jgi:hypothetical protein
VKGHLQKNRILTRALKKARCTRTLTFILSLTGRGNRPAAGEDLAQQEHRQTEIIPLNESLTVLLSPLPVRERMKVRVLIQRALLARESGFCTFSRSLRASKEFVDCAKNLFYILKHLAVPESKHSIALRLEKRGADFIFSRSIKMLRPIELDDEPSLSRAEIGEVCPDRKLASKLRAAQLPIPQMPPQNPLRLSLLAPQAARIVLGRFNRSHRIECLRSVEEKQVPRKEQNPDPRAKDARCIRTLTFILSLTGRGDRKGDSIGRIVSNVCDRSRKNKFRERNGILTRAREDARCMRTLTFILSLTGRGDRKAEEGMSITQLDRIVTTNE